MQKCKFSLLIINIFCLFLCANLCSSRVGFLFVSAKKAGRTTTYTFLAGAAIAAAPAKNSFYRRGTMKMKRVLSVLLSLGLVAAAATPSPRPTIFRWGATARSTW